MDPYFPYKKYLQEILNETHKWKLWSWGGNTQSLAFISYIFLLPILQKTYSFWELNFKTTDITAASEAEETLK